ncbi:MAG: phosphate ABC transporter substrate-binding protein [Ktedonobacteraceae bacterium]|nr:phosphate ABC transporter substrate-binding protein [Ktedonobacteraceae bacterium]
MSKRWSITILLTIVMAISVFISACGSTTTPPTGGNGGTTPTTQGSQGNSACVSGSITAAGSTALQPFVQKVAEKYQAKCPGAKITVQPGGSKTGLNSVENGTVQIGNSDIPALATQTDLVDHQVAVVIFVVIINPDVKGVTDLKTSDILGIYTGKVTNWKQVGGPDLPITVVSRPTTSGTRSTFKKYMLGGANETPAQAKNLTVESTGTVVQTVQQTSGSIGYVTLGGADAAGSAIVAAKIDGQDPTVANCATNAYKFWNIEHMYTKGAASGLAQAFLDYMTSSDASTVAEGLKFAKISDIPQSIRDTHSK